jgi:hypothetical protein
MYPICDNEYGFNETKLECLDFKAILHLLSSANNHLFESINLAHQEFPVVCRTIGLKEIANFYINCSFEISNFCYLVQKQQFEREMKQRVATYKEKILRDQIMNLENQIKNEKNEKKKNSLLNKLDTLKKRLRKTNLIKWQNKLKLERDRIMKLSEIPNSISENSTELLTSENSTELLTSEDVPDIANSITINSTELIELPINEVTQEFSVINNSQYPQQELHTVREVDSNVVNIIQSSLI